MLNIEKQVDGTELVVMLEGRLDTTTAPELEKCVKESIEGVSRLIFDFEKLEYVSSAGLRVLLSAQKIMNTQGTMIIRGASDAIKEIFKVVGFLSILTIE